MYEYIRADLRRADLRQRRARAHTHTHTHTNGGVYTPARAHVPTHMHTCIHMFIRVDLRQRHHRQALREASALSAGAALGILFWRKVGSEGALALVQGDADKGLGRAGAASALRG